MSLHLQIWSDLHLENGIPTFTISEKATHLIIAGDLGSPEQGGPYLWKLQHEAPVIKPILYIFGNHEYYDTTLNFPEYYWHKMETQIPGLFLLNECVFITGKYRFLGTPLWSEPNLDEKEVYRAITERCKIKTVSNQCLLPQQWKQMHNQAKEFLVKRLSENKNNDYQDIVISHYPPSSRSLEDPTGGHSKIISLYVNHLESLISKYHPIGWIHGHTHESCRYEIEKTWILSNPLYGKERKKKNPLFDPHLIIDLK